MSSETDLQQANKSKELNYAGILSRFPTALEEATKLANLRMLCIPYNNLTELPEPILRMQHLNRLDLSQNKLTTLPEFGEMPFLERLDLSSNKFQEFPLTLLKLKELEKISPQ